MPSCEAYRTTFPLSAITKYSTLCYKFCMYFNCIVFNAVSRCLGLVLRAVIRATLVLPYCPTLLFFSLLLIVIYCGQINDDDELICFRASDHRRRKCTEWFKKRYRTPVLIL